jgi:hypothetical protein
MNTTEITENKTNKLSESESKSESENKSQSELDDMQKMEKLKIEFEKLELENGKLFLYQINFNRLRY